MNSGYYWVKKDMGTGENWHIMFYNNSKNKFICGFYEFNNKIGYGRLDVEDIDIRQIKRRKTENVNNAKEFYDL